MLHKNCKRCKRKLCLKEKIKGLVESEQDKQYVQSFVANGFFDQKYQNKILKSTTDGKKLVNTQNIREKDIEMTASLFGLRKILKKI